jgi:hypothetical protein
MRSTRRLFGRLQWKLTLSYTAVTVGALLVVVMVFGALLFGRLLAPISVLEQVLSSEAWIRIASENTSERWSYLLTQDPVDTELISMTLAEGDLQISYIDLLQMGDLQLRARSTGEGSVLIVDPQGILLVASND